MRISQVVLLIASLHAGVAEARFGKKNSGGSSNPSPATGSQPTHAAVPVDSPGSSSSSSASLSPSGSASPFVPRRRLGYFNGAFVPLYGYGPPLAAAPTTLVSPDEDSEPAIVRGTAGLEFLYFTNQSRGYALGLNASVEIDRIGGSIAGQHLSVATDDGTPGDDMLQQLSVRVSYAILVGTQGRLRGEAGLDTIFAADVTVTAPTIGFSGTLWIAGPLAFEGSLHASVYPFWQIDGRAGFVVGLGALGIRVGWRTQLLDDQGVVDGVEHRDIFMGPYAGLGFAF